MGETRRYPDELSLPDSNAFDEISVESGVNSEVENEHNQLASKENKAVHISRLAILLGLILTVSTISAATYLHLGRSQVKNFNLEFESHASKVIEKFHTSIQLHLQAIDALSVTYTSYALHKGSTWPNVTLPDFELRASNSRILSGSPIVNFFPLVTDETRLGWEAFQIEHRDQYDDALVVGLYERALQDARFNYGMRRIQTVESQQLRDQIANIDLVNGTYYIPEIGRGPYLPIWQVSPAIPMKYVLNFNVLSHPAGGLAFARVLETGKAALDSIAYHEGEVLQRSRELLVALLASGQYRYDINKLVVDPTTSLGYPVFDSFNRETRTVVGVLATELYWRLIFDNVLSFKALGIIVVLENSLGEKLTYRIDGGDVSILGPGDLHDSHYDAVGQYGNFAEYFDNIQSPDTQSYTSVGLSDNFCDYSISVYPSIDTEAEYVDGYPLLLTLLVSGVFLFTALVLVAYDCLVARRQRIIMDRALASSAIVSSLFPSHVREQIYQETKKREEEMKELYYLSPEPVSPSSIDRPPIANEFENTTILFADLAGFTKWSSRRDAAQVFQLLETLYFAFDQIAIRRRVFKVETVGDCYVAVTGVPKSQSNHAVIMAKFAQELIEKTEYLVKELSPSLGSDTSFLEMRVGLHSGSVIGGVLRGQKSRFQLFGDAMNTAARMESNGQPGKIHVSGSTASALIDKGRAVWLKVRKDKIVAKGKGEMQTFWLNIRTGSRARRRRESGESSRRRRSSLGTTTRNARRRSTVGAGGSGGEHRGFSRRSSSVESSSPATMASMATADTTETTVASMTETATVMPMQDVPLPQTASSSLRQFVVPVYLNSSSFETNETIEV